MSNTKNKKRKQRKHNLRLPICFYCDLPFDHDFDDVVTPETQRLFVNYQPCEKCKEAIQNGFLLMGVVEKETFPNQPPITEQNGIKLYPTQNSIVLTHEIKRILRDNDPNLAHITDDTPGAYMPDAFVEELIDKFKDHLKANNDHSDGQDKSEK